MGGQPDNRGGRRMKHLLNEMALQGPREHLPYFLLKRQVPGRVLGLDQPVLTDQ